MILAGRHYLIPVFYKHTSLHVFFFPYISPHNKEETHTNALGALQSLLSQKWSGQWAGNSLSDVFGGLLLSCVPTEGGCALSWVWCDHSRASSELLLLSRTTTSLVWFNHPELLLSFSGPSASQADLVKASWEAAEFKGRYVLQLTHKKSLNSSVCKLGWGRRRGRLSLQFGVHSAPIVVGCGSVGGSLQ